jgi:hypothetical protein
MKVWKLNAKEEIVFHWYMTKKNKMAMIVSSVLWIELVNKDPIIW